MIISIQVEFEHILLLYGFFFFFEKIFIDYFKICVMEIWIQVLLWPCYAIFIFFEMCYGHTS
jgi:hypothetical protein